MTVKQLIEWLQEYPLHYDVRVLTTDPIVEHEFNLTGAYENHLQNYAIVSLIVED